MCEILITSELSGQLWNACVWDLHSCTSLTVYKTGSSSPRTMSFLSHDFLLSGVANKPLINVWALQRREQVHQRMVCPGAVSALCASPDNTYIVAAIEEKLHIWQVTTGNLLSVLHRHYQCVRCLSFTDDGSHFVSAGDDNLVLVWTMWKVLSQCHAVGSVGTEPRYTWSDHSLPVTDVHVGSGGVRARVATASLDQTCKLYDLGTGQLLLSVVFDCSLHSVLLDAAESRLFAGGSVGHVYTVSLHQRPVRSEQHVSKEEEGSVFVGHSKPVTCLCLSLDGLTLVSGSHDCSVRLWDVGSGQCTRTLSHKGHVTNVKVIHTPPGLQNPDYRPTTPIQALKRHLYSSQQSVDQHGEDDGSVCVRIGQNQEDDDSDLSLNWFLDKVRGGAGTEEMSGEGQSKVTSLQSDVSRLQRVNKDLYHFTVQNIINK